MTEILITGGAGFIGRWVTKEFLSKDNNVTCLDNLSNGSLGNIQEFLGYPNFKFINGDIRSLRDLPSGKEFDLCIHLAAQVNVQESLNNPRKYFENNVVGTQNILEFCLKNDIKLSLVSTCMVYDTTISKPISENHPVLPRSPYAASKLAAEELAFGYYYGYGLPLVITRPFNTYGPYQKGGMEGGVVAIFIKRKLNGEDLLVFGDGNQTRDFLYVEDCAKFIYLASLEKKAEGEIINAGYGMDVSVNELAKMISQGKVRVRHIPHHHPQSEIRKLLCDTRKAKKLLGWEAKVSLEEGIRKTEEWIKSTR
jgi:nucleoside-diphosphate-sugar epimerase